MRRSTSGTGLQCVAGAQTDSFAGERTAQAGAIVNHGTLTLDQCTFSNHVVVGGLSGEVTSNMVACCDLSYYGLCADCRIAIDGHAFGGAVYNEGH